jgi:hypothetical protein
MKKAISMKHLFCIILAAVLLCPVQANAQFTENFDDPSRPLLIRGRGECRTADGVFRSRSAYACFGDEKLKDCRISFVARAPKDAEQVQIWAGFHATSRFDRYVVGMKGGLQDDLYLSRMGYMGADELLSLVPLDFHPETGVRYRFRIEVCRKRIRIFLNDEQLPRIDVEDANAGLAPQGYVTLGGGWITTEFDSLRIEPLDETALDGIPVRTYARSIPAQAKEKQRQAERATSTPVAVHSLPPGRTEIALDGHWLFLPDYEVKGAKPALPETGDGHWHLMPVPAFWNPIRIWLHGETMNQGKFSKGVSDTYYQQETVRCEAYTFDYRKTKAAWYRRWIDLPPGIEDRVVELCFDAVSKMADVYVNGTPVASHIGMFGEIKVDIGKHLKAGRNLIAVHVVKDYTDDAGKAEEPDYYSIARLDEHPEKAKELEASAAVTGKMLKDIAHGFYGGNPAGIWQPVKLIVSNRIKIADAFIRPALDGADIDVTVKNHSGKAQKISLSTEITETGTRHVFHREPLLKNIFLKAGEERTVTCTIRNLKPRLWSPQHPNLYDFTFTASTAGEEDVLTVRSGFRTFEVKDGLFHLNGKPYWLRGGNHTPFALAPNDSVLANSFYQIMKAGNIDVTRTHTSPYNKLWINAADEQGIGISHEGTWPWLMINASMPDSVLIAMWADEYLALLKKYRNHPSILFWTINNEMKFYDNEPDPVARRRKMSLISDVVKRMRKADPTRPISFDSNYRRNEAKLGKAFYEGIDDGDIDDVHSYINWYDHTLFKHFNGEFQRDHKNEGRPLISQEMSTGYPNNETGHATRFYTLVHQNPQTLVGYEAYAFGNPEAFLGVQAFITGELAEALRRTNDRASGILHFALLTWFRNVYDAQRIEPYPTYYALQRALQPVLVSAELWGRNFYAGAPLPARICVVNDRESGDDLLSTVLHWQVETGDAQVLAKGTADVPSVKHYARQWIAPNIVLPEQLPAAKTKAKLRLRLTENGREISTNEYAILLADRRWTQAATPGRSIVLVDGSGLSPVLNALNVDYRPVPDLPSALKQAADLLIISGNNPVDPNHASSLRAYIASGRKVLMLNSEEAAKAVFPEHIAGHLVPTEGDIVNMEIPESPVFDGIDLLELRYFNNNRRKIPAVCHAALQVNRSEHVTELAAQTKIHGYISGDMAQRSRYMRTIKAFPIIKVTEGKGEALISTMAHDKAATDPVAARLLANMINF